MSVYFGSTSHGDVNEFDVNRYNTLVHLKLNNSSKTDMWLGTNTQIQLKHQVTQDSPVDGGALHHTINGLVDGM